MRLIQAYPSTVIAGAPGVASQVQGWAAGPDAN
jgi:hypothetical protein